MDIAFIVLLAVGFGYAASYLSVKLGSSIAKESIKPFVFDANKAQEESGIDAADKESEVPYDWGAMENYMNEQPAWEEEENSEPNKEDFEKLN